MNPRPTTTHWQDDAACRGLDTELFFPKRGELAAVALAVCEGCPVRQPCLEHALHFTERFGIWGGTSERHRRKLRTARRVTASQSIEESAA